MLVLVYNLLSLFTECLIIRRQLTSCNLHVAFETYLYVEVRSFSIDYNFNMFCLSGLFLVAVAVYVVPCGLCNRLVKWFREWM